ncbi:MAG: hypothetical protein ACYC69_18060 [Thermodesulfovibrionales bacterium]
MVRIFKTNILIFFILMAFAPETEARQSRYLFDGKEFTKTVRSHGNTLRSTYCTDKIDLESLGISKYALEGSTDADIYVSPDERYFIFQGSRGRHGRARVFLADRRNCSVVRELTVDEKNATNNYHAVFSPDSSVLYISWNITQPPPQKTNNNFDELMSAYEGIKTIWLTKEYSGEEFNEERVLKNIVIPGRAIYQGDWIYSYKFSNDGKYLVTKASPSIVNTEKTESGAGFVYLGFTVLDIQKDIEVFTMDKWGDHLGKKKLYIEESMPYISAGLLLFNFEAAHGTEIIIYDYRNRELKNKIEVPVKGTGMFSSKGNRVIFSAFPDKDMWKKAIIIFDASTGKKVGTATLDEADEIIDISADDKQLFYKRDSEEKIIDLKKN